MAYNKKNYYRRVIEIQSLTKDCQALGMTNVHIYETYIRNHYHISKRTFDEYLGVPAERELKKLQEIEDNQTKLF
ncbi:MAG: hypothetical protein JNM71_12660 [Flavobacterium lindanitolerans]|uniref:hypothetical protein n=1 Tax=Flavobacterium lindanitolerans TaxID=428988 RepID=UPI001A3672B0|nr:hypothetical protein [Flavobacterium lindanitolerans]MBL7868858.1 hypothetical protein [Flavobacterium lindanitolerans]